MKKTRGPDLRTVEGDHPAARPRSFAGRPIPAIFVNRISKTTKTMPTSKRRTPRRGQQLITTVPALFLIAILTVLGQGCSAREGSDAPTTGASLPLARHDKEGDAADRFQQPLVLCYHQIRDWAPSDSKADKTYILPIEPFKQQMRWLHDNGYRTLLPDQWESYMGSGTPLPPKTVLITFDDGTASQYLNALPELDRYGFKAVFFIMTVTLDKPKYLSRAQIHDLSEQGHLIGCHTWDHHSVTGYTATDWPLQLEKPRSQLEQITNRPVRYFAYPYGSWNEEAIVRLKAYGYLAAFQLSGHYDPQEKPYTVKRTLVDGHWDLPQFVKAIDSYQDNERERP